eukprot:366517-Chlamydomonas_euryale.AAC.16
MLVHQGRSSRHACPSEQVEQACLSIRAGPAGMHVHQSRSSRHVYPSEQVKQACLSIRAGRAGMHVHQSMLVCLLPSWNHSSNANLPSCCSAWASPPGCHVTHTAWAQNSERDPCARVVPTFLEKATNDGTFSRTPWYAGSIDLKAAIPADVVVTGGSKRVPNRGHTWRQLQLGALCSQSGVPGASWRGHDST